MVSNNPNKPINQFNFLVKNFGLTANRPAADVPLYFPYFDATLNGWVYYDGANFQLVGAGSAASFFTGTNNTGSTIAANKAVASGGGASLIVLADSGTVNDIPVVGFTTVSIPNGGTGLIQVDGVLSGFSGLTPQARYFSDPAVPGGIIFGPSFSTNAKYQVLGVAVNSTTLAIEIGQRVKMNATATQTNFLALSGNLMIDTPIVITPSNNLGAVALQATSPGTQQTGNENISGTILAATMTASGTVQGATITSTGAVNGASEAITGASTAASYTATGTVQGATVNATSVVQLNGVTVLQNGTSFPGSPSVNQRYFRTDRNVDYYYDGTRWLSTQLITTQLLPRDPNSGGGGDFSQAGHTWDGKIAGFNMSLNGWYLVDLQRSFVFRTAQSGTNFYSCTLIANGRAVTATQTAPTDTKTYTTIIQEEPVTDTYNVVIANTMSRLTYAMVVNASPGIFFCWASVTYRLIG